MTAQRVRPQPCGEETLDHHSVLQIAAAAGVITGGLALAVPAWADIGNPGQHGGAGPSSSGDEKNPHYPCEGARGGGGGHGGGVGTPPGGYGGGPWGHGHRVPWRPPWSVSPAPWQPGPAEPDIVGATAGPEHIRIPEVPVLTAAPVLPGVGVAAGPPVELPRVAPVTPPLNRELVPPPQEPIPEVVGKGAAMAESFRSGYPEYLRTARVTEIAALALPGAAGILMLTAGGGFIGYRQAKAGHTVRTEGIARFLR